MGMVPASVVLMTLPMTCCVAGGDEDGCVAGGDEDDRVLVVGDEDLLLGRKHCNIADMERIIFGIVLACSSGRPTHATGACIQNGY